MLDFGGYIVLLQLFNCYCSEKAAIDNTKQMSTDGFQ